MKVLFCSPRGIVGGISQWTENILSYYSQENQEEIELTWYYSQLKQQGFSQAMSLPRRIITGFSNYLPFLKGLRKMLKKGNFDIAHFSTSGSISFMRDYLALRMCKHKGMQTALHFHFGRMEEVLSGNSLERKLFNLCVPYTDKFIAIDLKTYNALKEYGCREVHYLPNPLSTKVEGLIVENPVQAREKELVVFAGHVIRNKGVFELVEACRDLENVRLEILGKCLPETKAALEDIAGNDFKKRLNIRGNCSLAEVVDAMKRCNVFALPSYSEGFPNVIIEAMACEAPIVATTVGAIPQMIENCGLLVEPKNSTALKAALKDLLVNQEKAKILGDRAGKKVREAYSMKTVWDKLLKIWAN